MTSQAFPSIAVMTSSSTVHSVLKDVPYKVYTGTGASDIDEKENYVTEYVSFIVNHYDTLEDYVLFLRADPLTHTTLNKEQFLDTLTNHAYRFLDKTYWSNIVKCNETGAPHHPGLPLKEWYERLLSSKPPQVFEFSAGSQFMVPKVRILSKPKSFYTNLLAFVTNKELNAPTLERIWPYLF